MKESPLLEVIVKKAAASPVIKSPTRLEMSENKSVTHQIYELKERRFLGGRDGQKIGTDK